MTSVSQTTLNREVEIAGTALHSGKFVQLKLKPAPANHGIAFYRTDKSADHSLTENIRIQADFRLVHETMLGTSLQNAHGVGVSTVEHLMAAFAGCGIDNAIVTVDGPELPILDGSSEEFVRAIDYAGTVKLDEARQYIKIHETIVVRSDNKSIAIEPLDGFEVEMFIDFESAVVGRQHREVELVNGTFRDEISNARTFGFRQDAEKLQSLGLAQGVSLDNTIVVDGDCIMNDGGLRHSDEFVRHKILDAIGDLYLAGAPILGRVVGKRSGHSLNNDLLRALFDAPEKWSYVTRPRASEQHSHADSPEQEAAVA